MKPNLIIVRYSEIGLKADFTRKTFENILQKNIKNALKKEKIVFTIDKTRARFFVNTSEIKKTISVLKKIFAIKSTSPCFKTDSSIESMKILTLKLIKDKINKEASFAVRVKREGNHKYTSQDVAVILGAEIVKKTNAKVNLNKPDVTVFVEIRQDNAFFFFEKIAGPSGLPLGSQGKILSIVQSKDNMFLATWYMMHRGCIPVFLNLEKDYANDIKNFASKWYFNAEIVKCSKNNFCEKISKIISKYNCDAVVTNHFFTDNSDKVLEEIKSLKNCVDVPLLHPLIAMDEKFIKQKSKELEL